MTASPDATARADPLVLLHGFTQTGASWRHVAPELARRLGLEVRTPDLPGHGSSAGLRLDLVGTAHHLAAEHGPAWFVGYSLGGRVALHVAVHHPESVRGLVVIGATGGIDDERERADRRAADERLADEIERDGVGAFLDRWLAQPLFAGLPDDPVERDARRTNTAAGLAASLRCCGTGTQEPLWDRLGSVTAPVLVVAGRRDTKFVGLGRRLADVLPGARLELVDDAGHAVHLERPAAVTDVVAEWLASQPGVAGVSSAVPPRA